KRGGQLGVKEIIVGMAHRGRLNVLASVMSKALRAIFNECKGGSFKPDEVEGSGNVKYHLGASSEREFGENKVNVSLTAYPSTRTAVRTPKRSRGIRHSPGYPGTPGWQRSGRAAGSEPRRPSTAGSPVRASPFCRYSSTEARNLPVRAWWWSALAFQASRG